MSTYPVHPVAELFPLMSKDEFRGLVEDIRLHGQHESAVLWQGQLIDGRNRVRACQELGIEPKYCELDDDTDPVAWVVSSNLHRRHLSTSQRSMVASKLATLKNGSNQHKKEGGQNCPPSIDDAATMLNVSPRSVKTAKQVQEHGSDSVKQAVEQGTIPVSLAANLVKAVPDKREQTKLVRQGKDAVKQAVKEQTADRAKDAPRTVRTEKQRIEDFVANCDEKIEVARALFDSCLPGLRKVILTSWSEWLEVESQA